MPKISIVIPTRRENDLKECLSAIERHTKGYEVILVKRKTGLAKKINEGIKKAKGDYIILLHDDVAVTSGWADKLAEVGAFLTGENNDDYETWGGFYPSSYCQDIKLNPDYSFFMCISKKAMGKIYPFDEWYTKPWCQDVDMGFHIRKKGFKIECLPGKIIHRCGEGAGLYDEEQLKHLRKKWDL
jgi:GT2 family glycosyltransferase